MKQLRLHFCDFWPGFRPESNYFVRLLRESYEIVFDAINPELVICSVFGHSHYRYFCRKLCFIGENVDPDLELFDYSISFRPRSERNYRLPLYAYFDSVDAAAGERKPDPHFAQRAFCNFLYSNPGPRERVQFYDVLNSALRVDSGGRVRNNLGMRIDDKMKFLANYRFSIAFENGAHAGYITEKIFQPLLCGSIPIYWGASDIEEEFNAKSFVNAARYTSLEGLRDAVLSLNADEAACRRMIAEPIFPEGRVPDFLSSSAVLRFFEQVINDSSTPRAQHSTLYTLPSAMQSLMQQAHSLRYTASLQWRRLRNLSPDKLKFRKTSYSVGNTGDNQQGHDSVKD